MSKKETTPEVLNQAQAARYTGLSRMTLRKVLPSIPHRRAGSRVLIRREVLDRWLEGHDVQERK